MRVTVMSRSMTSSCGFALAVSISSACPIEDIPPCPGQCFAHTVPFAMPTGCTDGMGGYFAIPFTGPNGYRGRACFNSLTLPLVHEAIDHLRAGGQLSALSPEVQSAYESTVLAVQADLYIQCTTAAAGQCTNAEQICTGIAADAYEQLIVEQACVLRTDGTESVALGPGEVCHALVEESTGSGETGAACTDGTFVGTDAVDDTGSSDANGTSTRGETGETTGSVVSRG